MRNVIAKPHLFFFGLSLAFIILGFINKHHDLNINIGDIYYSFTIDYWFYISSIYFILIGINYYTLIWTEKPPKKWFTISHLFLQILSLFMLMTKNNYNWIKLHSSEKILLSNDNSSTVILIAILLFVLSILIHMLNFFISLFLKK